MDGLPEISGKAVMSSDKDSRCPRLYLSVFEKLASEREAETLTGDFEELYVRVENENGKFYSFFWFILLSISLIPSFIYNNIYWSSIMIKNYLKISLRNLKKYKGYSFINISGLAIGMACFILIMMYIQNELSWDKFHHKADNIYRVCNDLDFNMMGRNGWAVTEWKLADAIKNEYQEVLNSTHFYRFRNAIIDNNKMNSFENGYYADEHFLEIFTFPIINGDKNPDLKAPFTIVLSEKTAKKYFGDENPVGKVLHINSQYDVKVTGVISNIPENSHMKFDFLISSTTLETFPDMKRRLANWNSQFSYTYILLNDNKNHRALEKKLVDFVSKYKGEDSTSSYFLQKLTDIHLHSNLMADISANNDIRYIYLFASIGVFILLLACINYMNLSTARSSERAKEIGIRKVAGAQKKQLISQFIGESVIFVFLALLLAAILVFLFLPFFNSLINRNIEINIIQSFKIFVLFVLTLFFTSIFAGSYPAFYLSSFHPSKVLKHSSITGSTGTSLRNILVIFQFCVSIILISGTAVVFSQLHFIKNNRLGYNREHVIVLPLRTENVREGYELIKRNLLDKPDIKEVTGSVNLPTSITWRNGRTNIENGRGEMVEQATFNTYVNYDYLKVFEIEMKTGRFFSKDFPGDKIDGIVVNETLVNLMRWEQPVGKRIVFGDNTYKIIGVTGDIYFQSFEQAVKPLTIRFSSSNNNYLSARISSDNIPEVLEHFEKTMKKLHPEYPFNCYFLDDVFNRMYSSEHNLGKIFGCFSGIAIIIACLGLLGLASFNAARRTKEIGVRKVLGASIANITILLSREFTRFIIYANIIALPVAYYAMNKWLQNFVYRIDNNPLIFILSGILAFLLAVLTVSYKSIRAARANPVDSLRYE